MRVFIACECSGRVREAFRAKGHDAWSCDLVDADDGSPYHIKANVLDVLGDGWDLMIAHPPCTRLANAGRRWLHSPPKGKTMVEMWKDFFDGVELYKALRDAPIPKKCIENPVMHDHAREAIQPGVRQVVQPWHFGDEAFKATGFELIGLPELVKTNVLVPPDKGTDDHKRWSWVHRASPGKDRAKKRSVTFQGIANAMADQWG